MLRKSKSVERAQEMAFETLKSVSYGVVYNSESLQEKVYDVLDSVF